MHCVSSKKRYKFYCRTCRKVGRVRKEKKRRCCLVAIRKLFVHRDLPTWEISIGFLLTCIELVSQLRVDLRPVLKEVCFTQQENFLIYRNSFWL